MRNWKLANIHMYLGVFAALFLAIVGVTGAVLAFEDEIDRWLNRNLVVVQPQGSMLALDEVLKRVSAQYPTEPVAQIGFATRPDESMIVVLQEAKPGEMRPLSVNPFTGAVIGNLDDGNNLVGKLHNVHVRLAAGPVGSALVTISSLIMLFLCISAIWMWLRHGARLRFNTTALGWHRTIGITLMPLLLLIAITAVRPVPAGLVVHSPMMRNAKLPPTYGSGMLSPSRLLAAAQAQLPGASPMWLDLTGGPWKGAAIVQFRYPEDKSPRGRSLVWLNAADGRPLFVTDSRKLSPVQKWALMWNREIHTGKIFGLPTQILAFITGLAVPAFAVTGVSIWWKRRRTLFMRQQAASA